MISIVMKVLNCLAFLSSSSQDPCANLPRERIQNKDEPIVSQRTLLVYQERSHPIFVKPGR